MRTVNGYLSRLAQKADAQAIVYEQDSGLTVIDEMRPRGKRIPDFTEATAANTQTHTVSAYNTYVLVTPDDVLGLGRDFREAKSAVGAWVSAMQHRAAMGSGATPQAGQQGDA